MALGLLGRNKRDLIFAEIAVHVYSECRSRNSNAGTTPLVVDSNILYTKTNLRLSIVISLPIYLSVSGTSASSLIPKVVISKLVFQKVMYAAALIADAAKALKTLSRLTESETVAVEDYKLARPEDRTPNRFGVSC